MHLRIDRMPRMLMMVLPSILFAITASVAIAPQAHADKLPTIASLISEDPKHSPSLQVRIDDDPTPLSSLIIANINSIADEEATDSKLEAFMDAERASEFYFAQGASGRCTITSVAMMLRRAAFIDGREDWRSVALESTMSDGWTSAGVKNEFGSAGYEVSLIDMTGSKEALLSLLDEHPEGVAIYDRGVPHALLLCDYDEQTDTFYCADPADHYSGKRIPLADSWNGERHGKSQDAVISGISGAWVIKAKASL